MTKLPPPDWPTVDAIYAHHETASADWRREHLGASIIGRSCSRHLWYLFRWAVASRLPGRILRLMERGQFEEDRILAELFAIGVTVHDRNPEGQQWGCTWFGGHFAGRADGVGLGFLEAPKTWHLIEIKTANARRWKEIAKKGVKQAQPAHWAQTQVYMHGLELKRCFYLCVCKDDDAIYAERIHYSTEEAQAYINKAERIVFSDEPPERISTDPDWYECRMCDHRDICQGASATATLERNCRTCLSSTPLENGTWRCELHEKTLDLDEQKNGCEKHLFVTKLMPKTWCVSGGDAEARRVCYTTFTGGVVDENRELVHTKART